MYSKGGRERLSEISRHIIVLYLKNTIKYQINYICIYNAKDFCPPLLFKIKNIYLIIKHLNYLNRLLRSEDKLQKQKNLLIRIPCSQRP